MTFLNSNDILYAGLLHVIKRGTGEILEENEHGIFLLDTISNIFMLATDQYENDICWLKKYEHLNYSLLLLFRNTTADFARQRYQLQETLNCFQAVYLSAQPPVCPHHLQIKSATHDELQVISENYKILSENELLEIIRRKELFIGYHNGTLIGFIGQHPEGSMGLLEVLPPYRGNGYGTELESFMIAHMLTEGSIPFCQIEIQNEKSLNLQKKLGLTISKENMYWLF